MAVLAGPKLNVALVDPFTSGHHPTYLRLMSRVLLELGHRLLVFGPEGMRLREWVEAHEPRWLDRVESYEMPRPTFGAGPGRSLRQRRADLRATWRYYGDHLDRAREQGCVEPDLVWFMWLDGLLGPLQTPRQPHAALRGRPWAGLYFHPRHLRPFAEDRRPRPRVPFWRRCLRSGLKASASLLGPLADPDAPLRAPSCRFVGVLDEGIAGSLERKMCKPVVIVPDIADDTPPDPHFQLARDLKTWAGENCLIGSIGSQAPRKGLPDLLALARAAQGLPVKFAAVGRSAFIRPEHQRLLRQPPPNCALHLQPLPDEAAFNALVAACDVIFAAYRDFRHSSNILNKAAIFRKPVIVSDGYLMAERVRRYRLGLVVPEGDLGALTEAVKHLLRPGGLEQLRAQAGFNDYRRDHSLACLARSITTAFERIFD